MTSNCWSCIWAKGKRLGMTHSPGDNPGDAIFCTNTDHLNESGIEVFRDPDLGYGALVYRVEIIDGEDATCEAGHPE